jgi:four helix bundle protein
MEDKLEKIALLQNRSKKFALDIILFYKLLKKEDEIVIIGKQLIRSATSVAANYRAACRARSDAEFFSKMCIVVEEADESLFWLELLTDLKCAGTKVLSDESSEILKIMNSIKYKANKKD